MHPARLRCVILFILLSAAFAAAGRAGVHLRIPLTITDVSGHSATVYFGVDPLATYCIDPALGEFELPSDRCGTSAVCAYFVVAWSDGDTCLGNGLLLNYHPYVSPFQDDEFQVMLSSQNYPLTVHWPQSLRSYYDSAKIYDSFGGMFGKASMTDADSLVITNPVVNELTIRTWGPSGITDGVPAGTRSVETFALYQNYPNPFNPSTSIVYDLPSAATVTLRIVDLLGREVATLVDRPEEPGRHVVDWNPAAGLASGAYCCQLRTQSRVWTRMMELIR